MSHPSAEYDKGLLKGVPKLDKRTIQEGYIDPKLLEETGKPAQPQLGGKPTDPESSGRLQPQRGSINDPSASREALIEEHPQDIEAQVAPAVKSRGFWKTTKGRIIIGAAVVIVIVAAVVGGVVGSRKKNGDNKTGTSGNTGNDETEGPEEAGDEQTGSDGQDRSPVAGDTVQSPTTSADSSLPTFGSLPQLG